MGDFALAFLGVASEESSVELVVDPSCAAVCCFVSWEMLHWTALRFLITLAFVLPLDLRPFEV
jgi:hypothetical protein